MNQKRAVRQISHDGQKDAAKWDIFNKTVVLPLCSALFVFVHLQQLSFY